MNRDQLLRHLELDGWCVLEGLIPADQVEAVRQSVEATVAQQRNPAAPPAIGHVPGIINFDQSFAPFLANQNLLDLIGTLLGPHPRVSFTTGTINYPGNERGGWHADWPFNQHNAGHFPTPYADLPVHVTTLWMLSPFSSENGGTLVVPGSHRAANNPTGGNGVDPQAPYPSEVNACGPAGSVLVFDSRLWHATAPNRSAAPRTSVVVRYAPWWLNLEVLRPGSDERRRLSDETGIKENVVPALPAAIFAALPAPVQPLFRHWVTAAQPASDTES
ncbi:MAG: phytanoyl-CoA dioxygenase [Candidatus Latescibacteria bacterium]|nr:phytanoyl-CoA dioxygenase [Candidatus Latescibacterota bacterium]